MSENILMGLGFAFGFALIMVPIWRDIAKRIPPTATYDEHG